MKKLTIEIVRSKNQTACYEINARKGMTVLEAVEEIYFHHDPTIAYRYSCRSGLCTTCMMLINGKPGLSCMKAAEPGADDILHLAPLPKGRTVKDLMKEM